MPKRMPAADFNMSETIREMLTENPKLSSREVAEAIATNHPSVKINKNSFSVAYYTGRKKLGISVSGRKRRSSKSSVASASQPKVNLATLQSAARFLRDVGGAEAAIEAIKQVQAVQVK